MNLVGKDCDESGKSARVFSSLEKHRTSNIELRTPNEAQVHQLVFNSMLGVGCSLLDVSCPKKH
jgi:hypothetical protein